MEKTRILDPTETAVEQAGEVQQNGTNPNIITMSTGVKFRVKAVSRYTLASISERYSRTKPKAPVTFVEAKGRDEVNYDDPDYLDALGSWRVSNAMAVNNFLLLRGTELIEESVPDGMVKHDSDEWRQELEILGVDTSNALMCRLEWMKTVACPHNSFGEETGDIPRLLLAVGRLSGTAQEDVSEAVQNFRD